MTVMTDDNDGNDCADVPGPPAFSGRQLRELVADDMWLDELIDRADEGGVALTGPGGFLPEMIKAVLERGLAAELTGLLGYESGIRSPRFGELPQRLDPQDGAHRDRRASLGRPQGP